MTPVIFGSDNCKPGELVNVKITSLIKIIYLVFIRQIIKKSCIILVKINKQNKNGKEVSIIYGDDNSINVNIFNNKILMEIVGSFDNNLKELERISGSKIYFRGNTIAIKGRKKCK